MLVKKCTILPHLTLCGHIFHELDVPVTLGFHYSFISSATAEVLFQS